MSNKRQVGSIRWLDRSDCQGHLFSWFVMYRGTWCIGIFRKTPLPLFNYFAYGERGNVIGLLFVTIGEYSFPFPLPFTKSGKYLFFSISPLPIFFLSLASLWNHSGTRGGGGGGVALSPSPSFWHQNSISSTRDLHSTSFFLLVCRSVGPPPPPG